MRSCHPSSMVLDAEEEEAYCLFWAQGYAGWVSIAALHFSRQISEYNFEWFSALYHFMWVHWAV